jgi:hypothetical protein
MALVATAVTVSLADFADVVAPAGSEAQDAEPEQADNDQIDRDDEIEQPRHDQNENSGDQRDDRRQIGNGDGHGSLPLWRRKTANAPGRFRIGGIAADHTPMPAVWLAAARPCGCLTPPARRGPLGRSTRGDHAMPRLSAPTQIVFLISLALAVLAVLGLFINIPVISIYAFWIAIIAYVVLALGCLLKGT